MEDLATPNNTPTAKSPPTTINSSGSEDESPNELLGIGGSTRGFSGSTGRLPSTSEAAEDLPKARSTTPPADTPKSRGTGRHAWGHVKGMLKSFGGSGFKTETDKKSSKQSSDTLGDKGAEPSLTVASSNATSASSTLENIAGQPSGDSGDSSDDYSSSPSSRPNNLPLSSAIPSVPLRRMKKKKSSIFFTGGGTGSTTSKKISSLSSSGSPKCVDLRKVTSSSGVPGSSGVATAGGFTSVMKKIRKSFLQLASPS